MNVEKSKEFNNYALICLILVSIYIIIMMMFSGLGSYLTNQPDCKTVVFLECTGTFNNSLANIYNPLTIFLGMGSLFFIPLAFIITILGTIFSGISIYNNPDKHKNMKGYIIATVLVIIIILFLFLLGKLIVTNFF